MHGSPRPSTAEALRLVLGYAFGSVLLVILLVSLDPLIPVSTSSPMIWGTLVIGASAAFWYTVMRRRGGPTSPQAVASHEERFGAAFEGSAVPMAISTPDGRFETVNPAFADFVRVSRADLVGRHFSDITHPDERTRDVAAVRERLRDVGDMFQREKRYVRGDGTVVWGLVTATLVAYGDQKRHFVQIQNLGSQKQAERHLAESEAFFRRIVQEIPVGILYLDPTGGVTFANTEAQRLTGLPQEVLEGVGWVQAIHPDDRARVVAEWERPLAAAEPHRGQGRCLHSDGTVVWFEAQTTPIKVDGTVVGQLGFVRDTTERHLVETSLQENEARLRAALQAGNHGLYDVDLRTGAMVVNDDYCRMLGYAPGTLRETVETWAARLHPADRHATQDAFDGFVTGRLAEYRVEYRQRTASGGWKWILSLGSLVERGSDGRPQRLVGTHTDIDAQRRRERALRLRAETNRVVTRAETDQQLFEGICGVLVESGGYRLAWVGIPRSGAGRPVEAVAVAGEGAGYVARVQVSWADEPVGWGPTGLALRTGDVQVAGDLTRHAAFAPWRAAAKEHGLRSSAAVPLVIGAKAAGAVNVYADAPEAFDAEEISLLSDLARDVAHGIDALRARQQVRALATMQEESIEAERARVSRELHDELGQALTGIKLDIAWLRNRLADREGELVERLNDMLQLVDGTVDTVRRISAELRPGVLDDLGLEAAVRWLVREFGRRAGAAIRVEGDAALSTMDAGRAVAAFRIVQEALTNAARYAPGADIVVQFGMAAGRLQLSVRDNGPGFDPDAIAEGGRRGLGLLGMQERARMHGGTVQVDTSLGSGTTIKLELPVTDEAS